MKRYNLELVKVNEVGTGILSANYLGSDENNTIPEGSSGSGYSGDCAVAVRLKDPQCPLILTVGGYLAP